MSDVPRTADVRSASESPLGRDRKWARRLARWAVWFVVLDVLAAALLGGLRLRRWMWIHTDAPHPSLRFDANINNAYRWGALVLSHANEKAVAAGKGKATDWRFFVPAYVGLYREVIREHPDGQYDLDYTPARLLADALWVRHERLIYPHVRQWQRTYSFNAPLLWLNIGCELLSALGAFLLVRHWVWRSTLPAGTCLAKMRRSARTAVERVPWNPHRRIIVDSPPDLDRYPVPPRGWVLGIIAALLIWFDPAMLYDAHVYPQWEVWLLPSFFFAAWLASRGNWLAAGLVIPIGLLLKGQLSLVLPVFILWPLFQGRWRSALWFIAGCLIAAIALLSPWLIRLDFGWLTVGFIYPTHHWQRMGGDTDNLPAILESFGWSLSDPLFSIPLWPHHHWEVTVKTLLVSIYVASLLLCAWGMARKCRRNDPAFLIAMSAPWILMFTLLTQMNDRYLLWAAAATATTIAIGLGWGLLHVLISAIATCSILRTMLTFGKFHPEYPRLTHFLLGLHPGISWAVVLSAAIFLYSAVARSRPRLLEKNG